MKFPSLVILSFLLLHTAPAMSHEFWIDPPKFQVENGEPVLADLRNGELFKGSQQSYFERTTTRFEVTMGDATAPIAGRMGDRPAIQLSAPAQDGLMILAHVAAPAVITYNDWAKFAKFVAHKDFSKAEATHAARGWD